MHHRIELIRIWNGFSLDADTTIHSKNRRHFNHMDTKYVAYVFVSKTIIYENQCANACAKANQLKMFTFT